MNIQEICAKFEIGGTYIGCEELTTGNINSTYHVIYERDLEDKHYIVQKINTNVFKNPDDLMENIIRVTHHVRQKISERNLPTKRFVLRVYLTKENHKPYFLDDDGSCWRIYRYIRNSITYDSTEDLNVIKKAGEAFGIFQNCLDGFDATVLHETIPNFHNTPLRYEAFHNSVKKDAKGRVASVSEEVSRIIELEERVCMLQKYLDDGSIPLRVTHNDTKCNNVAFDKTTGEALAVLDLDTVMPGAIAYDFGDAIRFIANTCKEDDPNVSMVAISLPKYKAFAEGFLSKVKEKLTELEVKTLNLGVLTMTVELAMRFLNDYIDGDVYFKTKYPGHNLDRARNQIALAKDIVKNYDKLEEVIKSI